MRGSQIVKCLCRAWVDRYGIFEHLFRYLELSARECAQAKQVKALEMLRKFIQDLAAERLGFRIPALAIGRIRAAEMIASACFFNFFCNRAFWNARAPAPLLCKDISPEDARDDSS